MHDSEQILVDRLRSKDTRAFELVFNDYYSSLRSYAFRYMDAIEDADEVVQEVFVKFWEKCETLAPDSSIKSYLYRSVHNTCLNFLKHKKVQDAYKEYIIHFMEEQSENEVTESANDTLYYRITTEIEKLPPRCREIFKLSRFEGLKYMEIADHLSISVKTVEVQMGKALKTLREKLKDLKGV